MFHLIVGQILARKGPLFLVLLSWLLGGYLIYENRHRVFAYMSHFFSDPSLPKKQDPSKAYTYIKRAQLRIKEQKVDLNIMEKSCKQLPIRYRGNAEQFTPDWLESLENWKLRAFASPDSKEDSKDKGNDEEMEGQAEGIAKMPGYWKAKQAFALLSLKDAVDAMRFAYEIDTAKVDSGTRTKRKLIIVPRLLERYAKALCKKHLALLAWGEYLIFQERRQGQSQDRKEDVLSGLRLRRKALYRETLRNYLGETFVHHGPTNSLCQGKGIQLRCISPKESIRAYQKLIRVEKASQIPKLRLQIAQSYLLLSKRENGKGLRRRALAQLDLAAQSHRWGIEARLQRGYIWLEQKQYRRALEEVRYLKIRAGQPGFPREEFSNLARRALIGAGRTKAADCFALLSKISYGDYSKRNYCQQLKI